MIRGSLGSQGRLQHCCSIGRTGTLGRLGRLVCFLLVLCILGCGGKQEEVKGPLASDIRTELVSDSVGHKVGEGLAYATISIESPVGITPLCQSNFAIWLSTVLDREMPSDSDPVKALARAWALTAAANNNRSYINNQTDLEQSGKKEVYTKIEIRKHYENSDYITYMMETNTYTGGLHGGHSNVGYTFNKTDMSLSDLISPDKVMEYRKTITDELGKKLVRDPSKLFDLLLVDESCRSQGLVPLPANGAYLEGDSLVFQYQEYEIAPYSAGMPSVSVKFN